jgi:hypothetical protein
MRLSGIFRNSSHNPSLCNASPLALSWVSPAGQAERFYLRILLSHVPGPLGYDDLRTVDNHVCPTFREACYKRGLLKDDREWQE